MPQNVSGLAASIRGAVESETFDLAGQNVSTIENNIRDAFSEPFTGLTEMIRITFVTGAGKLGRQKYDENAAKALTSALRDLGFEEDRGASAVMECAGSFKLQHDTGKNLKTVVVFPKVAQSSTDANVGGKNGQGGSSKEEKAASLIAEGTPEHKIAFSSVAIFKKMVSSMCPSWGQMKGVVTAVDDIKTIVESLDNKLLQGTPLTDSEQEFYDTVSMSTLEDKLTVVREEMHKLVDAGRITASERRTLLAQVRDRVDNIDEDMKEAKKEKKEKRLENLKLQKQKAEERKVKIEKIDPKPAHALKNESEIAKLRKELGPILDMEDAAKGRLLTLKESQVVARKDEILAEIEELEQSSRGWYESDVDFANRVKASQNAWQTSRKAQQKKKKSATAAAAVKSGSGGARGGGGGSALPSSAKWTTPAPKKAPAARPEPTKPARGGGVFAAMMADSDSD